jgi:hypothetical protein
MGTTNINIQGIPASGGGGNNGGGINTPQGNNQPQNAGISAGATLGGNTGGASMLPSNERMIEDIRREMRQRGVMLVPGSQSMHKIIDEYTQSQRKSANQSINDKYDALSSELKNSEKEALEQRKKQRLANAYINYRRTAADTPDLDANFEFSQFYAQAVQRNKEDEARVERGGGKNDDLLRKAEEERLAVDKELAERMRQLTAYFEREAESGAPRSYLGQLKEERKQLILERDSATTEEEAIAAQAKINDVNSKISRVMSGKKKDDFDEMRTYMMTQNISGAFSSLQQGDLVGGVGNFANAAVLASGMGKVAARRALGWIGLAMGVSKGILDSVREGDDVSELWAILGGVGGDYSKFQVDEKAIEPFVGLSYTDLGMELKDFSQAAINYSVAGGVRSGNWKNQTLALLATERDIGLQRGELAALTKYSRGAVGKSDFFQPAYAMGRLTGSFEGFTTKDKSNAKTVLNAYESILQSYSGRSNSLANMVPAANLLGTLAANYNGDENWSSNLFDERTISDIQTIQNMIQNPANDRMQALIYGEVGKILGTNDLSKIDRYIINPENELEIMQKVVKKITDLYGGTDTEMGYFAFKQLLPGMAPDRRDEYLRILTGESKFDYNRNGNWGNVGDEWMKWRVGNADLYVNQVTQVGNEISDWLSRIWRKLEDM